MRALTHPLSSAFATLALTIAASSAMAAPLYDVQLLSLPAGVASASTWAISDTGHIVGNATNGPALYWSNGTVKTFGTSKWAVESVNDAGQVAAWDFMTNRAYKWNPATGTTTTLQPPSGTNYATTTKIFDNGSTFGTVRTSLSGNFQPYLWKANGTRVTMPGWTSDMDLFYSAANDEGVAIIQYLKDSGERGTLRWDTISGTVTPLSLDGTQQLLGYSNDGHLIGMLDSSSPWGPGFIWTEGAGFTVLPLPVGTMADWWAAPNLAPAGVNAQGWVVGTCSSCSADAQQAVVYDGQASYFLDDLIANELALPSGLKIDSANAINNNGWIVATGSIDGLLDSSGFPVSLPLLLVPIEVPVPASWALLLIGLGLTSVFSLRRRNN